MTAILAKLGTSGVGAVRSSSTLPNEQDRELGPGVPKKG